MKQTVPIYSSWTIVIDETPSGPTKHNWATTQAHQTTKQVCFVADHDETETTDQSLFRRQVFDETHLFRRWLQIVNCLLQTDSKQQAQINTNK